MKLRPNLARSLKFLIVIALALACAPRPHAAQIGDAESTTQIEARAAQRALDWTRESTTEAVALYRRAADERLRKQEPQLAIRNLAEAAKIAPSINLDELDFLDRADEIVRNASLPDEAALITSLRALRAVRLGERANAETLVRRAVATATPATAADANFAAGVYEYYFGSVDSALAAFETAQSMLAGNADPWLATEVPLMRSFCHLREARPAESEELMLRALAESDARGNRKGRARTLTGLSTLSYQRNEAQQTLERLQSAAAILPSDFESAMRGDVNSLLGSVYIDFGDLDLAADHFRRASEDYSKDTGTTGKLTPTIQLGNIERLRGNFAAARTATLAALAEARRTGDSLSAGSSAEILARIELDAGNPDEALARINQALAYYRQVGGQVISVEHLSGLALLAKGDRRAARIAFEKGRADAEHHRNQLLLAENLYQIAKLDAADGRLDDAIAGLEKSVDISDRFYQDFVSSRLRAGYLSSIFERYELSVSLLMRAAAERGDAAYATRALAAAERSRTRTLLENMLLSSADTVTGADAATVAEERRIHSELNARADKLTDLLGHGGEKSAEVSELAADVDRLAAAMAEVRGRLQRQSPRYAAASSATPFDIDEFRRTTLSADSVLLEFALGEKQSFLWVAGRDRVDSFVLPPRAVIEELVGKLSRNPARRAIGDGETIEAYQLRIKLADDQFASTSAMLSAMLFGDAMKSIGDRRRLIVVADGQLNALPFASLPLPDASAQFVDRFEVVLQPSAMALTVLLARNAAAESPTRDLLVFSDPVFSQDDTRLSGLPQPSDRAATFRFVESFRDLPRLGGTAGEATAIESIVGRGGTELYSGFSANRQTLLGLPVENYKIIHFATHGIVDELRPELSAIVLSRFGESGEAIEETLRLHDIYGLRLNADLVVLSACRTAVGKETRGEGMASLNNAFLQTGARSVLSTLWQVDDAATVELMKHFYSALIDDKLPAPAALRKAQLALRENPRFSSPFYWAAFTVQGDFRTAPQVAGTSVPRWPFATGGGLLLILIFFIARRRKP